jgi:DNA-binding CsgD family transcriptional regulator
LGRDQVLDYLTMLVDKSLATAEGDGARMRYRLLETMRAYALEKLEESGEEHAVRSRHRDHYASFAAGLDSPARAGHDQLLEQVELEIDNVRAAFDFSRDSADLEVALQLASSLQALWLTRGGVSEGLAWFDCILDHPDVQNAELAPALRARALADRAVLDASRTSHEGPDQVRQALAIARQLGDPTLLVRALIAHGSITTYDVDAARASFSEAMKIARSMGDGFTLCLILAWEAFAAHTAGNPLATRTAAEEGADLADTIGARIHSRYCRWCLGAAYMMSGDINPAIALFRDVVDEADAAHDFLFRWCGRINLCHALAYHGESGLARATAEAALGAAAQFGDSECYSYAALAMAALAAGDVAVAAEAGASAQTQLGARQELASYDINPLAQVALACGDLTAARSWSDVAVSTTTGWHLAAALTTRARVAIAQRDLESAERDARHGLVCAAEVQAHLAVPDLLECLAGVAVDTGSARDAARLFGSAKTIRDRMGIVRFKIYDADYESSVTSVRTAAEFDEFGRAWEEGAMLSTSEAIAYALRGHTGRKRPASGWTSLTPTELDIAQLVAEGLTNKTIGARLFISPRTVQTHLTHIYAKLGITSRVQLAQEVVDHA